MFYARCEFFSLCAVKTLHNQDNLLSYFNKRFHYNQQQRYQQKSDKE